MWWLRPLYLLPIADGQVLRLLQQLYPGGVAFTELDDQGQRALFNVFRVPHAALQAAKKVYVMVSTNDNPAAAAFTAPALDFAWRANPPAAAPFVAQVAGSLIVPTSGLYTFAAERGAEPFGLLLTLDDMLVLDTSLNMTSQQMQLAQGVYDLALTYRSDSQPGDLRITWQRPDGVVETIGGAALHWPAPAQQGLVASYYDNARFEGGPILQRNAADEGQSDWFVDRVGRRHRDEPARGLGRHHQPPLRRVRGRHDCRHCRGLQHRADQDRCAGAQRPHCQVQPVDAH